MDEILGKIPAGPPVRCGEESTYTEGRGAMSWTTNVVTQNGNSTGTWFITGGGLSTHDEVVVHPTAGGSGLRVNNVTVTTNPLKYAVSLSVVGGAAMAFSFSGEQVD
jgi:hypothetical protein